MHGGELPDASLVALTVAGDADAFAALYRRHASGVHHVVRGIVRDPDTAADITQDVFARVIEALGDLREPERFRFWIMAIARNRALDHLRMKPRSNTRSLDEDGVTEPVDPGAEPAELAELASLVRLVRGCIAGLSSRDATVLALVTQFGYKPAEVAAALEISPGAAKVVLHRARRRLRSALTLNLLAKNLDAACPTFREAFTHGQPAGAASHVATCAICSATVNDEVHLYHAHTG